MLMIGTSRPVLAVPIRPMTARCTVMRLLVIVNMVLLVTFVRVRIVRIIPPELRVELRQRWISEVLIMSVPAGYVSVCPYCDRYQNCDYAPCLCELHESDPWSVRVEEYQALQSRCFSDKYPESQNFG